jgi:hypothetical protein
MACLCLAGAGLLGGIWAVVGPPKRWYNSDVQNPVMLAWLLLSLVVMVFAAELARRLASGLLGRGLRSSAVALGLRLARFRPPGSAAALLSVNLLILVTGFSTALLNHVVAATSGDGEPAEVEVWASELPTGERTALIGLLESGRFRGYAVVDGVIDGRDDAWETVLVGTCEALFPSDTECAAVARVPDDEGNPLPGQVVTVEVPGNEPVHIGVPDIVVQSDEIRYHGVLLVLVTDAPWLKDVVATHVQFFVDATGDEYDRLLAALAARCPSAESSTSLGSSGREILLQQQSMLRLFSTFGFVFCVLTLCLAGLGLSQDQLRSITALQLVGVSRSNLRKAMAVSKAFSVAISTVGVVCVTILGGHAWPATAGLGADLIPELIARVAISAIVAVGMSALMGVLLVRRLDLAQPDARV